MTRTTKQTLQNNRDSKARHRRKSIKKMVRELNSNGIKAVVTLNLKDNYNVDKTYDAIRKQWSDLRLKKRIADREKYRDQVNKTNKERYKKDPDYKQRMLDRVEKQYHERKKKLERTTKIEECYFCKTQLNLKNGWHGHLLCLSCSEKLSDLNMRYTSEVAIG